jgi:hypothetical protein
MQVNYVYLHKKQKNLKGLIMQRITFIITMLLVFGSVTYADCVHEGHTYSEGTIRGPFICINGSWIRR